MKYIIDVSDEAINLMGGHISIFVEPMFKTGDCKRYALRLSKEDIKPHTEPDRKAIEDEVWEFVRAINYMGYEDFVSCFGGKTEEMVYELSYSEVKAEYEAWKNEIHVGDEVVLYENTKMVVTQIDHGTSIQGMDENGECYESIEVNSVKKTGRHFNEVDTLLKKMRGES